MKWEIEGADKFTAEDRTIVLETDDVESAIELANSRGLMVAEVRPLCTVKALVIRSPFAQQIARGERRIEHRRSHTNYRGLVAIVAAPRKDSGLDAGRVVCVVKLVDCVELGVKDYLWMLDEAVPITERIEIPGRLGLFDVTELIGGLRITSELSNDDTQ